MYVQGTSLCPNGSRQTCGVSGTDTRSKATETVCAEQGVVCSFLFTYVTVCEIHINPFLCKHTGVQQSCHTAAHPQCPDLRPFDRRVANLALQKPQTPCVELQPSWEPCLGARGLNLLFEDWSRKCWKVFTAFPKNPLNRCQSIRHAVFNKQFLPDNCDKKLFIYSFWANLHKHKQWERNCGM